MPSFPPVVWVVFILAAILVFVRILAKRAESHGIRVEEHERIPRSLEGNQSRRSKPAADSGRAPSDKDV